MMIPKQKPGQSGAADITQLLSSESKFSSPIRQDAPAYRKTDSRGQDRHETGPQQPPRVSSNTVLLNVHIGRWSRLPEMSGSALYSSQ